MPNTPIIMQPVRSEKQQQQVLFAPIFLSRSIVFLQKKQNTELSINWSIHRDVRETVNIYREMRNEVAMTLAKTSGALNDG